MGKKNSLEKFITALDIYGWPIEVNYRGSQVYRTRLGALSSLITYFLIVYNTINLLIALFDNTR